jgi:hypothetical protein
MHKAVRFRKLVSVDLSKASEITGHDDETCSSVKKTNSVLRGLRELKWGMHEPGPRPPAPSPMLELASKLPKLNMLTSLELSGTPSSANLLEYCITMQGLLELHSRPCKPRQAAQLVPH